MKSGIVSSAATRIAVNSLRPGVRVSSTIGASSLMARLGRPAAARNGVPDRR